MEGMTPSRALLGIGTCGLLVMGLLTALAVHGQHLQALLVAQCRHNAMQCDCLQRLHRNGQELPAAVRVERAHVAQLQRKVELLQALLNEVGEAAWR